MTTAIIATRAFTVLLSMFMLRPVKRLVRMVARTQAHGRGAQCSGAHSHTNEEELRAPGSG